jgi:cellobiose phosphorylase
LKKKFENKYGYFSEDGNEYIIKNYKTPKPWINIITNGNYGLTISQTGGGFSWLTHSEFNRITRWHQDLIQDNWGKYIYIKNNKTGEIWNPAILPVKTEPDLYECTFGFGYTIFKTEFKGIKIFFTLFVPGDDNLEIWDLKVENNSKEEIDLSFYTYFEWCLGSSADHHREFHKTFIETSFDRNLNSILATKRLWEIPLGDRGHWNIDYEFLGYFSSNRKIENFETSKESFLGQYGNLREPEILKNENFSGKTGSWDDPIACLKINLRLEKGKTERFDFYLGLGKNKTEIEMTLTKYKDFNKIDDSLKSVKRKWLDLFGKEEVKTPDEQINFLANKWLKYQAIAGRLWGRTAYYQQSGAFGFRDQLQDSIIFLPLDPDQTANQIKLHARHQFKDGTVLHWWHPITETGLQTKMTDDLLWLPFLIIQYLKETNDLNFVDEKVEYYDNSESGSLYSHSLAAINKVLSRFSSRNLPLIGAGDWNDGLSAAGLDMKGESIWLAEFFYYVLEEFLKICDKKNDKKTVEKLKREASKLKEAFDRFAWDGGWYFRATKDSGEKIGSSENLEGKIYLNTQTWSVISGIASGERQKRAMESVKKFLLKKNGPLLLSPAYTKPDKFIGYLSRYAPGRRENGGVYTHAAVWSIWAFALLKQPEIVYDIFKRISPINNGMNPDEYFVEPFVTPGNIDGSASPYYGRGGWTWYTGSAAWLQKIIVDNILGIKAEYDGLLIDPCIPKEWSSYSVKRFFRGTLFHIDIINQNHSNCGVNHIEVDGSVINSNIIPPCSREESIVKVFMK